ncbi:methyltransferase family protein [Actinomycetospora succinea]|uniref:Methyltransferase family protein n=1 Tax=Actinomycetospora succinea TaxID=663603 RepID=A0A4V3DBA6_9PSEU|nr:methyltransferase [Actinomycetospora succinea]TDQ65858.1 methyltransferase family protein [Actinomycetospora succinea]
MTAPPVDPSHILETGSAFWASKALLSAVELHLFTHLGAAGPMTGDAIADRVGLHPRATDDFLDALVALRFLERDGEGTEARYGNTPDTAAFLDQRLPSYVGGLLEMCNSRLYGFWGGLTEALRTGRPQNETRDNGEPFFATLARDPARLEEFMHAMEGSQRGNFEALASTVDFTPYSTICDAGGGTGLLSIVLASRYPHLRCTTFDLPVVEPIARKTVADAGLADRVAVVSGDFTADPLPRADVITMGNVLHDGNTEHKRRLIRTAHDALPDGGTFIVVENIIDDARRENAFGLLMSLNMLIEFGDAADYTGRDFAGWCREAGFREVDIVPLAGPASAGIARK